MQDEPTGVPINRATRFENKVGSLDLVAGESLIKKKILERLFIDLVVGESLIKERAAARFNDLVGSTDVVVGEPLLLLPRRFRQNRALMTAVLFVIVLHIASCPFDSWRFSKNETRLVVIRCF
jgi:hypothetical protein